MKKKYTILTSHDSRKLAILAQSLAVGLVAGIVIVLYRMTLTYAEQFSFWMYSFLRDHMAFLPVAIVGLGAAGCIVHFLVSKNKMISGSGIPQLKGILMGYFRQNWLHTLCSKFAGGAVAIAAGLSLGREGPSIQLGACVAEGIGNRIGKSRMERKILMASGASAGLAAAFNAPLAGVIFALEEIFKYFSPLILLSTMSAAVMADFVSKKVFGIDPVFRFEIAGSVPLSSYGTLILLGTVVGFMGAFYNYSLLKTQKLYKNIHLISSRTKTIIAFLLAGVVGIVFPVVLGGGHHVIGELNLAKGISFLILLFAVKFAFSMFSFALGAPGGIFFPLLVLGGTIGAIFAGVAISFFGYDEALFFNFVILAMAGYFTAIVRAPITGIVLIMEMTGSFSHLLSLSIVALTAYVVADLLKSPPIYDALLEKQLAEYNIQDTAEEHSKKIMVEMLVQHGSQLEDRLVKEINWPRKCLLVSIRRGEMEILPKGDTVLKTGDYLLVLTDINSEWRTREKLEKLNSAS